MDYVSNHCDQGPRDNLEDTSLTISIQPPSPAEPIRLCLVADGVGGHNFGEVASAIGLHVIVTHLVADLTLPGAAEQQPAAIRDLLIESIGRANDAILDAANQNTRLSGMSTTVVCSLVVGGVLYVAWCGDSRAYLVDGRSIEQLTTDHSEVQRLVEAGLVDPDVAKHHPLAHTINRFLGSQEACRPEVRIKPFTTAQTVVLCSDGLTDVVPDHRIAELVADHNDDEAFPHLASRLVQEAIDEGTTDNVTVVCHTQRPPEPRAFVMNMTQTGAYHASVARALHLLTTEPCHA
jgi:protein phosphatase